MKLVIIITITGAVIGAVAGWLYWKYIGCASGSCPITARPLSSTLYGALMGALLFHTIAPGKKGTDKTQQQIEKHDKHA